MEFSRRIIVVLVIAAMATITILPCSADEKDEKDIWTEEEPRGPRPGPRRGPGPGRGLRRFELTDEEIDRVMEGVKQRDPERAKELEKLREEDPEKFRDELRRHARKELGKVIIEKWHQKRRTDFLEWLEKNIPEEAQELTKLKETNPDLYTKKYELAWKKYGRISNESKRHPELARVLLGRLELKKRQEELVSKIKAAKNEKEKKKLIAQLEEVVGDRYDLLIIEWQIEYERVLRQLEMLQKWAKERRTKIVRYQNSKAENVKQRTQDLLEEIPKFNWD